MKEKGRRKPLDQIGKKKKSCSTAFQVQNSDASLHTWEREKKTQLQREFDRENGSMSEQYYILTLHTIHFTNKFSI